MCRRSLCSWNLLPNSLFDLETYSVRVLVFIRDAKVNRITLQTCGQPCNTLTCYQAGALLHCLLLLSETRDVVLVETDLCNHCCVFFARNVENFSNCEALHSCRLSVKIKTSSCSFLYSVFCLLLDGSRVALALIFDGVSRYPIVGPSWSWLLSVDCHAFFRAEILYHIPREKAPICVFASVMMEFLFLSWHYIFKAQKIVKWKHVLIFLRPGY
jgi:hypothetical protein